MTAPSPAVSAAIIKKYREACELMRVAERKMFDLLSHPDFDQVRYSTEFDQLLVDVQKRREKTVELETELASRGYKLNYRYVKQT